MDFVIWPIAFLLGCAGGSWIVPVGLAAIGPAIAAIDKMYGHYHPTSVVDDFSTAMPLLFALWALGRAIHWLRRSEAEPQTREEPTRQMPSVEEQLKAFRDAGVRGPVSIQTPNGHMRVQLLDDLPKAD